MAPQVKLRAEREDGSSEKSFSQPESSEKPQLYQLGHHGRAEESGVGVLDQSVSNADYGAIVTIS